MLFPALDTLRLKASTPSSSSSSHSQSHSHSHSHSHSQTRPSHFRTPPIDFIDSRASTPHLRGDSIRFDSSTGTAALPKLHKQSSFSSLTKVDPFARIGNNLSNTLSVNRTTTGGRSDRPDSVQSFGTDFVTGLLNLSPAGPATGTPVALPIETTTPLHTPKHPSALGKRSAALRQPSNTSLSSYEAPPDNLLPFPKPSLAQSQRSTSIRSEMSTYAEYGTGSTTYRTPGSNQRFDSQRSAAPRVAPRSTSLTPVNGNSRSTTPRGGRGVTQVPSINVQDDEYANENVDTVPSLPNQQFDFGHNRSISNAGRLKGKSDKMLGLDPNTRLCSLFMISGLRKADPSKWIPADREASNRISPAEDSMNFFWRPEALNTTFPSDQTEKYEKIILAGKKARPEHMRALGRTPAYTGKTPNVADAGPDGAEKMMNKALKYAHPKEVEIVNSSLQPNSTAHYFSFTLPCHTSQARNARERLDRGSNLSREQMRSIDMNADARTALNSAQQERELASQADITFHGATLTVWIPAEPSTVKQLKVFRTQLARRNQLDQVLQAPVLDELPESEAKRAVKKGNLPWLNAQYTPSTTDLETASEWEADSINIMSDDETRRRKPSNHFRGVMGSGTANSSMLGSAFDMATDTEVGEDNDATPRPSMDLDGTPLPVTGSRSDKFWIPFALTLVSRHPIYETMIDYIRLDWTKFSKDARMHTYQICKILNAGTPRPGEALSLRIGNAEDAEAVTIHTRFPGGVDFDKGLIQTDFMLWPLFHAVDVDLILTCVEVALSTQGRVVITSAFPTMLCLCVNILKYMVELRGWHGITLPTIHARDISFIVEDPGPYIVGVPAETRWTVPPPAEVCILNLDEKQVTMAQHIASPLNVVTPRGRREKVKHKIFQALGNDFPIDRSVPKELKVAFLSKRFRTFNKVSHHKPEGTPPPAFLADKVPTPAWWKGGEVLAVFDKIMLDKHKKPSLIQRLTKSGLTRYDAQVTVGEQLAQAMMRRRALHYLESRDNLDDKTAKVNQKLMQLMQDGEKYKRQFEAFSKQADFLAQESIRLQAQMEKEQKEAQRLSHMNSQQGQANKALQDRLRATEDARAQAMRQLSDMQENMHDLEKEREEIMNTIEAQINTAIEHLPYNDMGSPMLSSALSLSDDGASLASLNNAKIMKRSSRSRPGTSTSAMSANGTAADGLSITSQDKAVSVLGAARDSSGYKRQSSQTQGTAIAWGKGEVADRMAAIQAKLNLALTTVTEAKREAEEVEDQPSDNDAATIKEQAESDAATPQIDNVDLPAVETVSSTKAQAGDTTAPKIVRQSPTKGRAAARQLAAVFIPPPPPIDEPVPPRSAEPERPPKSVERGLSTDNISLVKPGQLRVKPKNMSARSVSPSALQLSNATLETEIDSAVIPHTPAEFGAIGRDSQQAMLTVSVSSGYGNGNGHGHGHGNGQEYHSKGMTRSSTASTADDLILSPPATPPSADMVSVNGSEEGMMRRHSVDVKSPTVKDKEMQLKARKSRDRVSTGTVAFGPM